MNREFNVAPLSGGYMITSMVGFLISVFLVEPTLSKYFPADSSMPRTWAFTLVLFFVLMFVASMISMTYATSDWPLKMERKKIR